MSNNLIIGYVTKKMYPDYICYGKIEKEKLKEIKKNVVGLMIGKICIASRNSLDNICISIYLDLATVAMYGNYYSIFAAVNAFIAVITSSMHAGVGNSIAVDSVEKNYRDFNMFTFLYMWIAGWCTICLLCLYQPFMEMWMGKKFLFPMSTVTLFCVYFYCLKLGDIRSIYSNATGMFWNSRYYVVVESFCNIILNFILVKYFGVNGIIIATNISIVFVNFICGLRILFKNYFKNNKLKKYILSHICYALVTIINCMIVYISCYYITFNGIFGFIIRLGCCIIIPNIFYWLIYRKTKLYKESKNFVLNSVIKKI